MRRLVLALPLSLLLLTGCAAAAPEVPLLEEAAEACGVESSDYARIGDEGRSLTLDQRGEADSNGLGFDDVDCVLKQIDMPDSAYERMTQTSSLDGFQDAEWDNVRATWSYHPDDGLDVILETVD